MGNHGKIILFILLTNLVSLNLSAQRDSTATENRAITNEGHARSVKQGSYSIMFQLFGPEGIGVYGNYYLIRKFSINAGFGFGTDAHIGANYYLTRKQFSGLYLGAQVCRIAEMNLDKLIDFNTNSQTGLYIPVGVEFNSKRGFIFSAELGYNMVKTDYDQLNTQPFVFAIRLGGVRLRE